MQIFTLEDVSDQLCDFLQTNILAPDIKVNLDTELSSIGVDSFSLMELVLFIERRFDLILPPEALTADNIATVKTLSRYCISQLNNTND